MSEYEAYGLRVNLANIAELHAKAMNSFNLSGAKPNHIGHIGAMTGDLRVAMRALTRELGFDMNEPGACSSSFYKNLLMMGATRGTEGILHFVEQNKKLLLPAHRHAIESSTPSTITVTASAVTDSSISTRTSSNKAEALQQMGALMAQFLGNSNGMSREEVLSLIEQHAPRPAEKIITIVTPESKKDLGEVLVHDKYDTVLKAVANDVPVMLVGPAGSGKTTLCEQVAKTLEMRFYFTGAVASEYKLSGFVDAQGRIVSTAFREAYKNGGLFLFDEVDASMPQAIMAFNAALANGHCDFPGDTEPTKRHESFRVVAAANTYGRGADRQYVGRNQLDAASLDRFAVIEMDYDETLEVALCGNKTWAKKVQRVRQEIAKQQVRHIVSPRASIMGAKLLAAGFSQDEAMEATVWKGLDKETKARIVKAAA